MPRHGDKKSVPCRAVPRHQIFPVPCRAGAVEKFEGISSPGLELENQNFVFASEGSLTYERYLALEVSCNSLLILLIGLHQRTSVAFDAVVSEENIFYRLVFLVFFFILHALEC